jgi:hypothetical protein
MPEKSVPNYTAYALKRESRTSWSWLEIGEATRDEDGKGLFVYLNRLPTGGFNGRVYLREKNWKPPPPGPEEIALEGDGLNG